MSHPLMSREIQQLFLVLSNEKDIRLAVLVVQSLSDLSHEVARVWSFSFSISPSSEYLGLISFRIDWLDLLAVQETLKSLL